MTLILKQHVWIQKGLLEGVQLWHFLGVFYFVDEGREDPNTTKRGTSSAHQRNAI